MAKSPLGRVEMLADHFGAGKEMIMGLILGQNSADDVDLVMRCRNGARHDREEHSETAQ